MLDRAHLIRVEIDISRPGKPTDNANKRVVQWSLTSGVPERHLDPVAGGCP